MLERFRRGLLLAIEDRASPKAEARNWTAELDEELTNERNSWVSLAYIWWSRELSMIRKSAECSDLLCKQKRTQNRTL